MSNVLMVIDMQNDFVTESGALYFKMAEKVKPVVVEIVKDRMSKNYDLIFTKDWHDVDDKEFDRFNKHCIAGTTGADLFEDLRSLVENYDRTKFVLKNRFSAFYGTNMDEILKDLSTKKIEVCGVDTNICVMYTVEELRNRDYDVLVYEDGTGSYDLGLHHFAISQIRDVLGAKITRWR